MTHEPGPELDALIADRVMGWQNLEWSDAFGRYRGYESRPGWRSGVPDYSTWIAAAWEVVNRMTERGYSVEISSDVGAGTEVGFFLWNEEKQRFDVFNGEAGYKQAPYAICLAALAAVEEATP